MAKIYLDSSSFRPLSTLSSSKSSHRKFPPRFSSRFSPRSLENSYTQSLKSVHSTDKRKRRKKQRRKMMNLAQCDKYDLEQAALERGTKNRPTDPSLSVKRNLPEPSSLDTKPCLQDSFEERPGKVIKLKKNSIWAESSNSSTLLQNEGVPRRFAGKIAQGKNTSDDRGQQERRCKIASYASRINQHRIHSRLINASWAGMPSSAQKGIYNPAVLCYRNSLLQALIHTPKVVNWLRTYHGLEKCTVNNGPCVACRLLAVFESYWGSTPKDLLNATKELDKTFRLTGWQDGRTGRQEDPEEQFVWLAKVLSEQLPSIQFDAFEAISRFTLNSTTKCTSCGYISVNKGEVEGTISIDLQPKVRHGTIAEYLEPYFSYRVEGFKCERCSSRSPKRRTREICHQPETLVIQLKRFGWDGRKNNTPIPFSTSISLDKYRSEENSLSCEYDLSAIICHYGGIDSGHYVCRAKGPDERWMKFDDLQVTKITQDQALHPGSRNGWTPYLFFYQRKIK